MASEASLGQDGHRHGWKDAQCLMHKLLHSARHRQVISFQVGYPTKTCWLKGT
jgi:hypothetical protein